MIRKLILASLSLAGLTVAAMAPASAAEPKSCQKVTFSISNVTPGTVSTARPFVGYVGLPTGKDAKRPVVPGETIAADAGCVTSSIGQVGVGQCSATWLTFVHSGDAGAINYEPTPALQTALKKFLKTFPLQSNQKTSLDKTGPLAAIVTCGKKPDYPRTGGPDPVPVPPGTGGLEPRPDAGVVPPSDDGEYPKKAK